MTSRSKKDRKQRHTIQLSRSSGTVAQSTSETKSDRQHFLDRLSLALPNDAAEDAERREIEHLFSQLPVIDSPKRSSATSPRTTQAQIGDDVHNNQNNNGDRRHRARHGGHRHRHLDDSKHRPSSPSSSAAARLSSSAGRRRSATIDDAGLRASMSSSVSSPRLPSLEELGVPLPPVVVHMLELDRAKRRDTVKSMLKQCSKEDRTRFRYELQRLRQQHAQKKADNARLLTASASSVPSSAQSPAPAAASSSKLERAKTATGAVDASSRHKTSAAATANDLRPASTAAPPARPTVRANGVQRDEADVIRRLSVNASLKRILSGYVDDDDDSSDDAPAPLVPPPGATAQSPRNGANSSGGGAASTSQRLSYGGISAQTRAPPSTAALEQHSDSDSDAPPLPPSSTAPSLDLDELLGV